MCKINKNPSTLDRHIIIPKTPDFDVLVKEVGDTNMAEFIWAYWNINALNVIHWAMPALNRNRKW